MSAAVVLLAAAITLTVDPLQLFRPASFYTARYSSDTRMQDAGLIRSQPFDTLLMGTSMAIHFRQSDIDRELGVKSLKLSMTGSNSREQTFVLKHALERHPKRVIWEVDDWIFHNAAEIDDDVYFPADLYRRNIKGVASYLFSGSMARESLWLLAHGVPLLRPLVDTLTSEALVKFSIPAVEDIYALAPSFEVASEYNADHAMASFRRITAPERRQYLGDGYDGAAMARNFDRDAIGMMESHPDVQFDVYFPPYSILQWIAMREASPQTLQTVYGFTSYIARRLASLPNARLHDFRAIESVTHDLGNYSDVIHHSPVIDLKVLEWLASGKYAVDRETPTASLDRLKQQVEAYKLPE